MSFELQLKTLDCGSFKVVVEPDLKISEVKTRIMELKGEKYDATRQQLLHNGKILQDTASIGELGIQPTDFVVCMVSKQRREAERVAAERKIENEELKNENRVLKSKFEKENEELKNENRMLKSKLEKEIEELKNENRVLKSKLEGLDVGCGEVVASMLNACGTAANYCDEGGMSPLLLASRHGLKKVVSVLVTEVDLNIKTKEGVTALMEAAKNNQLEVVQALAASGADINSTTNENMTALMFAAGNGHPEIVSFLVTQDISINACNEQGETALMLAIQHKELEIMQLLLDKGAAVNTQNAQGLSPLMIALTTNFLEGVSLLLKFNPENQLEIREVNGETALIMASKLGHQEFAAMLLRHGADIWARTFQGFTAKFVANCFGHFAIEDMLTVWERNNPQKVELKFANIDMNLSIDQYLERINLPHLKDFFDNLLMETVGEFKTLSQKRRDKIEKQLSISDMEAVNASLEAIGVLIPKFVSLSPTAQEARSSNDKDDGAIIKDAPA